MLGGAGFRVPTNALLLLFAMTLAVVVRLRSVNFILSNTNIVSSTTSKSNSSLTLQLRQQLPHVPDSYSHTRHLSGSSFRAPFLQLYTLPKAFIIGAPRSSSTSLWGVIRNFSRGTCTPNKLPHEPNWARKEQRFFRNDNYFESIGFAELVSNNLSTASTMTLHATSRIKYIQTKLNIYMSRFPVHHNLLHVKCYPSSPTQGLRQTPISSSASSPGYYFIDATPSYLLHPLAAERIKYTYEHNHQHNIQTRDLKFVAILREPVGRDYSRYVTGLGIEQKADIWKKHWVKCDTHKSLSDCYDADVISHVHSWNACVSQQLQINCSSDLSDVNTCSLLLIANLELAAKVYRVCFSSSRLTEGMYFVQLAIWNSVFSSNQTMVISTQSYVRHFDSVLPAVVMHLNLKLHEQKWNAEDRVSQYVTNSKQDKMFVARFNMSCQALLVLSSFYRPFNKALFEIIPSDKLKYFGKSCFYSKNMT